MMAVICLIALFFLYVVFAIWTVELVNKWDREKDL